MTLPHSVKSPAPTFAGVLYFWDISANRTDQPSMKILKRFRSLCGDKALRNTIFVMNFWNKATPSERESREKELSEIVSVDVVSKEAKILPFKDSYDSAWEIVDRLPVPGSSLLIQEEIANDKSFLKTTAAKGLNHSNESLISAWKDFFSKLRILS
jgi:hypothetical protein